MRSSYRTDLAIIAAFAFVAVLAVATPLTLSASPARFLSVLGAVILGPGALAYRLATRRGWSESLTIGTPLTVAVVMVLGLLLVNIHAWHPVPAELVIPAATLVLCGAVARRELFSSSISRTEQTAAE